VCKSVGGQRGNFDCIRCCGDDKRTRHLQWQKFQRAVDSGEARERQRALDLKLARQWPMANIGVWWAFLAILTWDLATRDGPYTILDREILTRPWMTVSSLPT